MTKWIDQPDYLYRCQTCGKLVLLETANLHKCPSCEQLTLELLARPVILGNSGTYGHFVILGEGQDEGPKSST